MTERLSNLGYLLVKKETTKGTAVIPDVAVPLYSETLFTNINMDADNPVIGQRINTYQFLQGQRDHQGELKVLAEPKTLGHFLTMLLTKGSTTGSGVYTHPFTLGNTQKSYTFDILKGDMVHRFYGVEMRNINPEFDENKMLLNLAVSALGAFIIAPISSASSTTVELATDYDMEPGKGLVAGDVLVFVKVTGGTVDNVTEEKTISSISSDKKTITLSSGLSGSFTTGDYCYIKAQTPTYTLGTPFNWARTEFYFGDTAAAALALARSYQTRVEKGSKWDITHEFEEDGGAMRSGGYDPAALVRTQGMATVDIKRFFDDGIQLQKFLRRSKIALVVRHFGDLISGSSYNELRLTFNNLKLTESPNPLNTGEIIYLNQKLGAQYDTTDTQAFDVKLINDLDGSTY